MPVRPTFGHVHNVERIDPVDDGQTETEPVGRRLRIRQQFVEAPSIVSIGFPCVSHSIAYGYLTFVGRTGEKAFFDFHFCRLIFLEQKVANEHMT